MQQGGDPDVLEVAGGQAHRAAHFHCQLRGRRGVLRVLGLPKVHEVGQCLQGALHPGVRFVEKPAVVGAHLDDASHELQAVELLLLELTIGAPCAGDRVKAAVRSERHRDHAAVRAVTGDSERRSRGDRLHRRAAHRTFGGASISGLDDVHLHVVIDDGRGVGAEVLGRVLEQRVEAFTAAEIGHGGGGVEGEREMLVALPDLLTGLPDLFVGVLHRFAHPRVLVVEVDEECEDQPGGKHAEGVATEEPHVRGRHLREHHHQQYADDRDEHYHDRVSEHIELVLARDVPIEGAVVLLGRALHAILLVTLGGHERYRLVKARG